jgi:hypothetical protein
VIRSFNGQAYLGNGSFYTNYLNVEEYSYDDLLSFSPVVEKIVNPTTRPDPRSFNASYGPGFNSRYGGSYATFMGSENRGVATLGESAGTVTPIILLPGDEIIVGIDAGIAPFKRDSGMITGSYLRIDSGSATITLFGSQVVAGARRVNVSSNMSYGESVHTADVDSPVLDEFLLERIESTYGNYHAPLATGSFPNRGVQAAAGQPTLFPQFTGAVDWVKYPRFVSLVDDRVNPIDSGVKAKFIFRNDKFGQPANMFFSPGFIASNVTRPIPLPGSKVLGRSNTVYPVTNIFTGSTTHSGNTSQHATSSFPFVEK